ncbi:hypothetical protein MMC10_002264 [Thelotrema lepadinum]|nr:hypothetical protein [Thelotrema lepadinum]
MDSTTSDSIYILQGIAGRGHGLVAAATIPKGTRILSEPPLFKVPRGGTSKDRIRELVSQAVAGLADEKRQEFFSLHNSFEEDGPEFGRARTNALPLGSHAMEVGLFLRSSRINHSCVQNAQNTWNEDLHQITIHAICDIAKGEEITILYLTDHENRAARHQALQAKFRFTCSCSLCTLPDDEREKSDKRCDEILKLDKQIGDGMMIFSAPMQALHNVHKLLNLLDDEGLADASVPRAYYDAFQIAVTHSDVARAKVFAERAAAARMILEGKDSTTVKKMESYARDPSQHPAYGYTGQWRTSGDSVPNELDKDAFERWLWRKEDTEVLQYADLRSEIPFPFFDNLPGENDINLDYLGTVDGFSYAPIKHWCFFGEIVGVESFLRLRLIVKDRTAHEVPIAFHTDLRGNELDSACLQEGYTVAILYAEQHGFLDFTVGVRHESPSNIKVCSMLTAKLSRFSYL